MIKAGTAAAAFGALRWLGNVRRLPMRICFGAGTGPQHQSILDGRARDEQS
jgi:hypothetical protein